MATGQRPRLQSQRLQQLSVAIDHPGLRSDRGHSDAEGKFRHELLERRPGGGLDLRLTATLRARCVQHRDSNGGSRRL